MSSSLLLVQQERRSPAPEGMAVHDAGAYQAYDDLAMLAAQLCGVSDALVAFADGRRHGSETAKAWGASKIERALSFCAHTAEAPDALLVVEDALLDPRFASSPLVTAAPHVRFYAGVPILGAAGAVAGTLCVFDARPRALGTAQQDALRRIARQAAELLALRETTARYRDTTELLELVLRGGDLGLWDLHLPSNEWSINAREREMLGYSAEEAQPGKLSWKALVHPDDWPVVMAAFAEHVQGKTPFCESTHRLRHRDGRWLWVMHRSVMVASDPQGRATRVVGTHMDITAQRAAEVDRRRNGERLELAMSGGDIGLWDLDLRTGKATYNDQWWRTFGYAPGEIEAVDGLWRSVVHPLDYEGARDGLQRHIRGETPMYVSEVRVRHKDGHWLWVENRAKVVERDAEGVALRIVGINLNITRSKEDRVALGRASELMRRTSTLASVGGWEFDPETAALNWSDEVYRIHDLDRTWNPSVEAALDFYAPEARPILAAAVESGLKDGKGWDLELPFVTAKGRHIWVRALGQAEWADGRVVRLVGTIQDITERRRANELLQTEQLRLRLITDNIPASVTHLDKNECYTFANTFAGHFFGADCDDMIGKTMKEVRGDVLYASLKPHVDRVLQGIPVAFENQGATNGRKFFTHSNFIPDFDANGDVCGFYAMTFDVTERKQAEMRSAESEKRLRGLTDNVPALLTELDLDGNVIFCNGRYQTWLGIPPESVINRPIRDTIGDAHFESRKSLFDRAYAGETVSFEQTTLFLTGERTLQTTYLPQMDAEGDVVGLYCLAHDVTDLKHKQMQLDALAREDALTGLPNRRSFEERVLDAMARSRRSGVPICLMYLDIDHFKSINDLNGHAGGDAVLKELARRIKASVRQTDTAARYAGDEFVVLLEGVGNEDEAALVARKILRAMRPPFELAGGSLRVTISIGYALSGARTEELPDLLARADAALYAAKKGGRNRIRMAASEPAKQ